jgi:TolB protein
MRTLAPALGLVASLVTGILLLLASCERVLLAEVPARYIGNCQKTSSRPKSLGQKASGRSLIAFTRERDGDSETTEYDRDLWVMNADGAAKRRLTSTPGPEFSPSWSPGGRRIVFEKWCFPSGDYTDSYSVLSIINADGSGERSLTKVRQYPSASNLLGSFRADPAWSPDGRRIAFVKDREIWIIRANGAGARRLMTARNSEISSPAWSPAWSPDGRKIVFSGGLRGNLFLVDAGGTGLHRLTSSWDDDRDPAWSPDGQTIAFTRWDYLGDRFPIWVMKADGSGKRRLTGRRGVYSSPSWSPDGRKLIFDRCDIWVMNAEGRQQRRLIKTPTCDWGAVWQPGSR